MRRAVNRINRARSSARVLDLSLRIMRHRFGRHWDPDPALMCAVSSIQDGSRVSSALLTDLGYHSTGVEGHGNDHTTALMAATPLEE